MARIECIPLEEMSEEQKTYYDSIMSRPTFKDLPKGTLLTGPFQAWVWSAGFALSFAPMSNYLRSESDIDERWRELAICVVARIWSAEVAFAGHSQAAVQAGVNEDIIEAIRNREEPKFERSDEEAVYRFAHQLISEYELDADTYQAAIDELGVKAVVELIGLMGLYVMTCMTLKAFQIPVREGIPRPFPDKA